MKTEIGGYLELEENHGIAYYENMVELNNGRNCLRYLIRCKQIKKIFMPAFLCDAVFQALENEGISFETYEISTDFRPMVQTIKKDDFIYVVNFYGQLSNAEINQLKKKFKNIIVDNAHAFFQIPVKGVDTIYTCRKFFGVPDGGYLNTNVRLNTIIDKDISYKRMEHLLGRYESTATKFYETYQRNDDYLDVQDVKVMSKLTQNLLKGIDYEYTAKVRKQNFEYLNQHLGKINQLDLIIPDGPFAYPFYHKNGSRLKKYLIQHQIFIPTLWPNVLGMPEDTLEYDYANNILPLPVDQRYGLEEMHYILDVIKKFNVS